MLPPRLGHASDRVGDHHVDLARQRVLHGQERCRGRADLRGGLGDVHEQQTGEMTDAAVAAVAERGLSRVRPHPGNQALKIVGREILLASEEERRIGQECQRLEVIQQVVRQPLIGRAGDDVRAVLADADRVAVGCRARDAADRDGAAGARGVLDDDGLPERRSHPLRQDARNGIGRSSGRIGHDDGDRLGWIGRLCRTDTGRDRQRGSARGDLQKATAWNPHGHRHPPLGSASARPVFAPV